MISPLNVGDQLDAIVLDFSKAFDRVPHKCLCMKLEHYGMRGPALHWLENFLSDRTQQVVLDGCCSDILPVTSGVPQGTILAPLLFLCYINDLPELVSCCCRLYADDVLLYKVIRLDEDYASLQSDLDVLQKWADDWQMRFNGLKCQHISFCSKQVQIFFFFFFYVVIYSTHAQKMTNNTTHQLSVSVKDDAQRTIPQQLLSPLKSRNNRPNNRNCTQKTPYK